MYLLSDRQIEEIDVEVEGVFLKKIVQDRIDVYWRG